MKESYKIYEDIDEYTLTNKVKPFVPDNSVILNKDNKLISQYLSYCSIENDLEFVREATLKLIEIRLEEKETIKESGNIDKRLIEKRSLFISILTSYSKCFNCTKNGVSLNEQFITKKFPDDLLSKENALKFHKSMIELRNKFVAHSDKNFYESTIGYMSFKLNDKYLYTTINYATGIVYTFNESELENMLILSAFLMKQVENKKNQLTDRIIKEFSKEELTDLGLNTIKNSR